jgi:hypothetical protein
VAATRKVSVAEPLLSAAIQATPAARPLSVHAASSARDVAVTGNGATASARSAI